MATICVQGTELTYEEKDIIRFEEGLIGMPQLRRMVLINYTEIAPLLLLCSLDEPQVAFLVLETKAHVPDYAPQFSASLKQQVGLAEGEVPLTLVTVTIAPEWTASTINLRAPIVIAPGAMRGVQTVLTDTTYKLDAPLPSAYQEVAVGN
ncbi:MAG: flagellar assembly protein FliW [Acidobacteria bacterium]|nr:flagellar assembly protein FliW [Acidobacteriota bacterium]